MQTSVVKYGHKLSRLFVTAETIAELRSQTLSAGKKAPESVDGDKDCLLVPGLTSGDETQVIFTMLPEERPAKGKGVMMIHEVMGVMTTVA